MTITGPSRPPLADPPPVRPLPLPRPSSDERFRRRREQRRLRRQRYLVVFMFVVALVGTIVAIDGVRGPDTGGSASGAGVDRAAARPAAPPVLLTEANDAGRAAWLTALVPGVGDGGTLLLIPPGTMAEVPSLGLEPVGNALGVGGASRLLSTAENVVGASLGTVEQVDAAALAALLQPAGALTVKVPTRVEDVLPSGRVQVLYEPGANRIEPDEVSRFLAAKGRDNDLARLARHQALWDAWLRRLADDPDLVPDRATPLGRALAVLARGRWQVRVLPVEAVGTLDSGEDIYRVDREALAALVGKVFPDTDVSGVARPRVRILNGTGELELAQRVAEVLVPAGMEITLTGNANPLGQRTTQVIYYDPDERAMAEKVKAALGVGLLVRNRTETDVVDVTVIVGKDYPPPT